MSEIEMHYNNYKDNLDEMILFFIHGTDVNFVDNCPSCFCARIGY